MLKIVGGVSLGGILSTMGLGRTKYESFEYSRTDNETDVLVVGGGPAGIIAAIQAARAGAKTAVYVHRADSSNSRTVTFANLNGRRSILEKVLKENSRLMHMQPEAGFRESYRILGETMITYDDYTSGRVFKDSISNAFYPVDLHTKDGVKPKPLHPGTVPTVPLRALVPKGSTNSLVAGRCVSSDRLANSGLRVQASCMAMGQAAGAAAALAVKLNTTPLKVPLSNIHELLIANKAIVPNVS